MAGNYSTGKKALWICWEDPNLHLALMRTTWSCHPVVWFLPVNWNRDRISMRPQNGILCIALSSYCQNSFVNSCIKILTKSTSSSWLHLWSTFKNSIGGRYRTRSKTGIPQRSISTCPAPNRCMKTPGRYDTSKAKQDPRVKNYPTQTSSMCWSQRETSGLFFPVCCTNIIGTMSTKRTHLHIGFEKRSSTARWQNHKALLRWPGLTLGLLVLPWDRTGFCHSSLLL